MAKQIKKTQQETKKETAPSAADFLNQQHLVQTEVTETEPTVEESIPKQEPAPELLETAPPEPSEPPAEAPQTEQKAVRNDRVTKRLPRRGDPCPTGKCPGNLVSFSRTRVGKNVVLFLMCSACNAKPTPNKQVIKYGH